MAPMTVLSPKSILLLLKGLQPVWQLSLITGQVSDDTPNPEATNACTYPPLEGDTLVDSTVVTVDTLKNTSEVEPDLTGDLASFGKNYKFSFL